jgi:hypothetical protein
MSKNLNQPTSKDTLAQWVSLSLRKALTENNIKKGFSAIEIWPFNEQAMDTMLAPSEIYDFQLHEGGLGSANMIAQELQARSGRQHVQGIM